DGVARDRARPGGDPDRRVRVLVDAVVAAVVVPLTVEQVVEDVRAVGDVTAGVGVVVEVDLVVVGADVHALDPRVEVGRRTGAVGVGGQVDAVVGVGRPV